MIAKVRLHWGGDGVILSSTEAERLDVSANDALDKARSIPPHANAEAHRKVSAFLASATSAQIVASYDRSVASRKPVIVSESNGRPVYHYWSEVSPTGLLAARMAILELVPKPGCSVPTGHLDWMEIESTGKPHQAPDVLGALEGLCADRVVLVEDGVVIRLKF